MLEYNVEKHIITKGNKLWKLCDNLCFKSKNVYNATLYAVRQHYFNTGEFLDYNTANKLFKQEHNPDYYALNTKVSQTIMKLVNDNFKSFFALKKKPECAENAKIPKYLHKTNGRQVAHFNNQAFSFNNNKVPKGYIRLSGTNIMFKTKVKKPTYVKVTKDSNDIYLILVGYEVPELMTVSTNNYASIDLGINNLATVTFTNAKPIIINGRPIKSINQYYNKQLTRLQSIHDSYINSMEEIDKDKAKAIPKRTKLMNQITNNRNNKINDYMHKASRIIVNHLVSNHISTLVIGYNKGWKQDINIGDKNNQNFVQIPFLKFINMLQYKCKNLNIEVILREESYTSKSSFLDRDDIPTYGEENINFKPSGKRKYRGLYVSKNNILINADVNGSYNILRKYLKEAGNIDIYNIVDLVGACSTPVVLTIK